MSQDTFVLNQMSFQEVDFCFFSGVDSNIFHWPRLSVAQGEARGKGDVAMEIAEASYVKENKVFLPLLRVHGPKTTGSSGRRKRLDGKYGS
jgi:hypothetical protein